MRTASLALVLLATSLSGCAGDDAADEAPLPEPVVQPDGPVPVFSLEGCNGQLVFFTYDDQSVSELLPEGYTPYRLQGVAGALVDLSVYSCESVTVGNTTYTDIALGWTRIGVHAPEHVTEADLYVFEWLLPVAKVPALAAFLSDAGWPVVDAEVTLEPGHATVRGPNVDYLVLDPADAVGDGPVDSGGDGGDIRLHHGRGPAKFLDQDYALEVTRGSSGQTIVATAGVLSQLVPPVSGGVGFLGVRMEAAFDDQLDEHQVLG